MRFKTSECMWCGLSEARGAVLKLRRMCFGGREDKEECVDHEACEARIKLAIKMGTR